MSHGGQGQEELEVPEVPAFPVSPVASAPKVAGSAKGLEVLGRRDRLEVVVALAKKTFFFNRVVVRSFRGWRPRVAREVFHNWCLPAFARKSLPKVPKDIMNRFGPLDLFRHRVPDVVVGNLPQPALDIPSGYGGPAPQTCSPDLFGGSGLRFHRVWVRMPAG